VVLRGIQCQRRKKGTGTGESARQGPWASDGRPWTLWRLFPGRVEFVERAEKVIFPNG
jgi:hypothetical protein